jgi:hypothetical protein
VEPGGYVDVASWIDEIAVSQKSDDGALRTSLHPGVSEGNLAALEDDEAPSSPAAMRGTVDAPSSSAPPPPPSSSPRASPPAVPPLAVAPDRKSATVGVVVALVVVMAAGAAAWFTHLIPHQ